MNYIFKEVPVNKREIIHFIKKYQESIALLIISLIAIIIGGITIGWLKSILIIGVIDVLLFLPNQEQWLKKEKKSKGGPNVKIDNYTKNTRSAKNINAVSTAKKDTKKKKNKKKRKGWKIALTILLVLGILSIVAFIIFMAMIIKEAPKFDPKNLYHQESSILYASNGKQVAKLGAENREKVTYDQLPEVLIDAIVATEDSRFFEHNGFDLPRFLKASAGQLLGRNAGGASTLTMQIVKNHFTSTTASGFEGIKRKFTDIYMSIFQVEQHYSKKEIMEFYVNAPYLGGGSWGVEQACLTYFGKSAKDLNLAEAAMIAGLFQAPNSYDPTLHPELTEKRRKTVLYLMERHGYITSKERKAAEKLTVDKIVKERNKDEAGSTNSNKYQAFIDTVVEEVAEDTGLDPYTTSMEIYTTLDTEKQEHISNIMDGDGFQWENEAVDAGVMVLNNQTGEIVAVGAGRNRSGQRGFNNATMMSKQIGSTAKPLYDYAPGIEYENWNTYTPFVDEKHSYSNGVEIYNWDRGYHGWQTLRDALAESRNIPALKAFQQNKNKNIKEFVTNLGLSPEVSDDGIVHEAHALGGYNGESPLTMAGAYAAFGNGGYYIKPHSYTKIVYKQTGETKENKPEKKRVMSEETAYIMTSLLQSSAQQGLGNQANLGNGAVFGAKTGTSNFDEVTIKKWGFGPNAVNDLWVNSTSPDYAISIWYGYTKINPNYVSTSYSIGHRRLFQAVAKGIYKAGSNWTRPNGVVEVAIERDSYPAQLPSEFTPDNLKTTELFKKGTEPTETSKRFARLDDPTNVKATVSGNTATITWNAIKTPFALDQGALAGSWAKVYGDANYGASIILGKNQGILGSLTYDIYSKTNGNLVYVGTTASTKYTMKLKASSPTTYVVKATYTNFKANASNGVEVKISTSNIKEEVTAELVGEKTITIDTANNETYKELGIIVKVDGTPISGAYTIKIEGPTDSLENPIPGVYTVTYTVTNDSYHGETLKRTVIVK